jgi:hypothetical protein
MRTATLVILAAALAGAAEPRWYHAKVEQLPSRQMGPFVTLGDGSILTVEGVAAHTSKDGGKTWSATPMFGSRNVKISNERALLRTREGTVIAVFMNIADFHWKWIDGERRASPDVRSDVWTARSLDDGRTWVDVQMIQRGYCGAVRDIIQTTSGRVVATSQDLSTDRTRHWTLTYSSTDQGKTWTPSNVVDLGGSGHHDGSIEPTIEQLRDGRLWMLLRTSRDRFWQAHSNDDGQSWATFGPSGIEASTAPALVKRLKSGRLILIWNRSQPEGQRLDRRAGGQAYAQPVLAQRGELALALSNNDGRTWTKPVVIVREFGKSLAYPYLHEPKAGEVWITTMQGDVRVRLREGDFLR